MLQYSYYVPNHGDSYICTKGGGESTCNELPPFINNSRVCNGSISLLETDPTFNETCINWNQYYTKCEASDKNPFKGAISFDNIGFAVVAIFQVNIACIFEKS
jgi:voltage-dependent calcium channel T type alpha-1G